MLGDLLRQSYAVSNPVNLPSTTVGDPANPALGAIFASLGGCVVEDGLYRVHTPVHADAMTALVNERRPSLRGRVRCFGSDWLGRQFALDRARSDNGEPLVLLLEPGTGETLEVPVPVSAFHDTELVEFGEEALAIDFYRRWRLGSGDRVALASDECVGYKVPLFLGGVDDVANLERIDIEVYWHLTGQLAGQAANLPPGTMIDRVEGAG